jgi:transmembrane sensor
VTEPKLSQPSVFETPDDVAAQWVVLRDRGFTAAEAGAFGAWLAESDANAEAWRRADNLWGSFDAPPDLLLDEMRKEALSARGPPPPWRQIAASVAVVMVLAGFASWITLRPSPAPDHSLAFAGDPLHPDYATAIGQRSSVTLADGSQVTLDTNSALSVRLTAGQREVRLFRGQAYFDVAPNPSRPFVVDAGPRAVTALGTAFSVRLDSVRVSVVLERGHVRIAAPHLADVGLAPGQMFESTSDGAGRVANVDLGQALAWRSGYLDFRDAPVSQAVAEMARYGGGRITFGDSRVAQLQISGQFRVGDPVRFARALSDVYPLRVTERPGGAEISMR